MTTPTPPAWAQAEFDKLGVTVQHIGEVGFGQHVFACMGDCCCWFTFDGDGEGNWFLDRYSFVNENGWCQGQHCACHNLPRSNEPQERAPT